MKNTPFSAIVKKAILRNSNRSSVQWLMQDLSITENCVTFALQSKDKFKVIAIADAGYGTFSIVNYLPEEVPNKQALRKVCSSRMRYVSEDGIMTYLMEVMEPNMKGQAPPKETLTPCTAVTQ